MIENPPSILETTLSPHGKKLHFPKSGIVQQAEEATRELIDSVLGINATAGVAYDDNGDLLTLPLLRESFVIDKNSFNYAPTAGLKELREAWLQEIHAKNPSLKSAPTTLPIVTNGLTHGINIACQLFLKPDQEAILADKYWDNYELMVEMGLDGRLKTFPTFDKEQYNLGEIKRIASEAPTGNKFFIFNVPNNPTGYSPTQEEQDGIVQSLREAADAGNEIIALCDDAYFGLAYEDNIAPESIFSKLANAHDKIIAVKIDGATKEEFAWGLRVGFITIGGKAFTPKDIADLENKISGAIRSNASNGNRPSQEALLKLLKHPQHNQEKAAAKQILLERFKACKTTLRENKSRYETCFKELPANSGYFLCVELNDGIDGEQVRKKLLSEHKIGIICLGNSLRIAFSAVNKDRIPFLFEKIYEVCSEQL